MFFTMLSRRYSAKSLCSGGHCVAAAAPQSTPSIPGCSLQHPEEAVMSGARYMQDAKRDDVKGLPGLRRSAAP